MSDFLEPLRLSKVNAFAMTADIAFRANIHSPS